MMVRRGNRSCPRAWEGAGLAGVVLLAFWLGTPGWAGQMYSYEDEHGTTVITNVWDSIPESARAKAKVIQVPDKNGSGSLFSGDNSDASVLDQVKSATQHVATTMQERTVSAGEKAPSEESTVYTLILSGILAMVMLGVLKLSSNASLKLLMKWLLVLLVFGTAAEIYFSQVGQQANTAIMQKIRGASSSLKQTQQGKAEQIDRMGPGGK